MAPPGLDLVLTIEPTPDALTLVAELDALLAEDYPAEQQHGLSLDEIFTPRVRFYIAILDGASVGCGAVALNGDWAEIKRMYTRPAAQGRGVARAILGRLEADARAAGAQWLRLETGDVLEAAIALYRHAGFGPCAAFGPYLDKPAHTVARSLFFEKRL